jgi:hypothetical protein
VCDAVQPKLPDHIMFDACDIFDDVYRSEYTDAISFSNFAIAALLWATYDVGATRNLKTRYVDGSMASIMNRKQLPKDFVLEHSRYDTHLQRWDRKSFPCNCGKLFFTIRETRQHVRHACQVAAKENVDSQVQNGYPRRDIKMWGPNYFGGNILAIQTVCMTVEEIKLALQTQFNGQTLQRRELFDKLDLKVPYTSIKARNFHIAVEEVSNLVMDAGEWKREVGRKRALRVT